MEYGAAISPSDRCSGLMDSLWRKYAAGVRNKVYSTKYYLRYYIILVNN